MTNSQYGLFCPLAMACEILEPRWTILILGELSGGASRFNEIRRGVPGISPTLRRPLSTPAETPTRGTPSVLRSDHRILP